MGPMLQTTSIIETSLLFTYLLLAQTLFQLLLHTPASTVSFEKENILVHPKY